MGEGRVGVQAVLNLSENRLSLKQRFLIREAVDNDLVADPLRRETSAC